MFKGIHRKTTRTAEKRQQGKDLIVYKLKQWSIANWAEVMFMQYICFTSCFIAHFYFFFFYFNCTVTEVVAVAVTVNVIACHTDILAGNWSCSCSMRLLVILMDVMVTAEGSRSQYSESQSLSHTRHQRRCISNSESVQLSGFWCGIGIAW